MSKPKMKKPLFGIQCVGQKPDHAFGCLCGQHSFCGVTFHGADQQQQFEAHVRTEHPSQVDALLDVSGGN